MATKTMDWDSIVSEGKKLGKKAMVEGKKLSEKALVEGKKLYKSAKEGVDKSVLQAKIVVSEQKIGNIIHKKNITVNNAEVKAELDKIAKYEADIKAAGKTSTKKTTSTKKK